MPLVGFLDQNGNKVSFNEALSGDSTLNPTPDLMFQFVERAKCSNYGNHSISVTSLLNCVRKVFLERTQNYWATPENLWYSMRGTSFHELLDPGSKMPHWMSERRFYKSLSDPINLCVHCGGTGWAKNAGLNIEEPCGCHAVSGQIDGYYSKKRQLLDKKSMGDKGLVYLKEGPKEGHVQQTNIYKWLMSEGLTYKLHSYEKRVIKEAGGKFSKSGVKDWWKVTIPVESIKIQYFTMMDIVISGGEMVQKTQFMISDPKPHPNEVKREIIRSYVESTTEKRMWKITYRLPEVPILPTDQVVSFVDAKRQELVQALQGNGSMPSMCSEEDRQWICNFCGCKEQCDAFNQSHPEQMNTQSSLTAA